MARTLAFGRMKMIIAWCVRLYNKEIYKILEYISLIQPSNWRWRRCIKVRIYLFRCLLKHVFFFICSLLRLANHVDNYLMNNYLMNIKLANASWRVNWIPLIDARLYLVFSQHLNWIFCKRETERLYLARHVSFLSLVR